MARILYAMPGVGWGHGVKNRVVIDHLLEKGHEVVIAASGQSIEFLRRYYDRVYEIHGLGVVYRNNAIAPISTVAKFLGEVWRGKEFSMGVLSRVAEGFRPQLVISDFEPFSSILARSLGLPLICFDNLHIYTNCICRVPRKYLIYKWGAQVVTRRIVANPQYYVINSFFRLPLKRRYLGNTFLVPTVLRDEVLRLRPSEGSHILVYQTSATNRALATALKEVRDHRFVIYGFNVARREGNLEFKVFSVEGFLEDLASSLAVIANGGLTLIGEALYLKKPVYSEPIRRQFEQILNALMVERCGYGKFDDAISPEGIKDFIRNIPAYRKNLCGYNQDGNLLLFERMDELIGRCCP
ncbi:MAG: glycosyltransferase family protein [bacterium]